MGATDHRIYKERGRMNIQIGLLLAVFVIVVAIGTIARRYELMHQDQAEVSAAAVNEAEGQN